MFKCTLALNVSHKLKTKNLHLLSASCIFIFIEIKVRKFHVQTLDYYNTTKKTIIAVFCIWAGGNFFINFLADIIIRVLQQVQFRMSP